MTDLIVRNATKRPILTWITLGATEGCVQDVAKLGVPRIVPVSLLQGYWALPAKTEARLTAPVGMGLNGNVSFDTPPLNCPTDDFPEGVNLAEFIINNGFQENGQETIDISCVCGANAFIGIKMSADDWTANGGAISVEAFANDTRYRNTDRVGVFPYGCDACTASVAPPDCIGLQPQYANAAPICTVQRPASGNDGGSVMIVYLGPTPVPA